jgi:hypothetical protein
MKRNNNNENNNNENNEIIMACKIIMECVSL